LGPGEHFDSEAAEPGDPHLERETQEESDEF
jgi:hypothetical protein